MVASHMPPTEDLACKSNQQPFGSWAGTRSTEPHQPGQILTCFLEWELWLLPMGGDNACDYLQLLVAHGEKTENHWAGSLSKENQKFYQIKRKRKKKSFGDIINRHLGHFPPNISRMEY